MPWLAAEIGRLGLTVTPSVANFILVHFAKGAAQGADAADVFLKARGIIVRKVAGYGLPDCLRITIGTEADNRAVVTALADYLGGRPA
jgi:histidinol-phosphate aminotransferase